MDREVNARLNVAPEYQFKFSAPAVPQYRPDRGMREALARARLVKNLPSAPIKRDNPI